MKKGSIILLGILVAAFIGNDMFSRDSSNSAPMLQFIEKQEIKIDPIRSRGHFKFRPNPRTVII